MREHHPGYGATIYEVEKAGDLPAFSAWLRDQPAVAIDTETTGLNWAGADFEVRLVQFGNANESYVVPARHLTTATWIYELPPRVYMHNAPFDILALSSLTGFYSSRLMFVTQDTRIMAHLLDPRAEMEGGLGHSLKGLSTALLDKDAGRLERELHEIFKTELKAKPVSAGWRLIPANHPTYVQYAGMDTIFTYRLAQVLERKLRTAGMSHLLDFEHRVQAVTTDMMYRGIRVDGVYTKGLADDLDEQRIEAEAKAQALGLENVNSPKQVAEALMRFGWTPDPKKMTATGQPIVDKDVLSELSTAGSPLALAVTEAKRAGKWLTSYVESMLVNRDSRGHIHPTIRSLAARTARMSVSDPPLQQLPTGDFTIRRCLVADRADWQMGGVDYKAIEMRVLAALADVKNMKTAILDGEDIHDFTAKMLYGPGFTPAQRKLAKNTGFGKVYGGGAAKLALTSGTPLGIVKKAIKAYDDLFPEISKYAKSLGAEAAASGYIVTPSGRRLPVDKGKEYAAVNYMVQSTARDVLAQGLLDLAGAGLLGSVLLPVHDEVLFQAPAADAEIVAKDIANTLRVPDFRGLPLDVDASVYGPSWGHGYGATA